MSIDVSGDDRLDVVGESFYRGALNQIEAARATPEGARQHMASLVPDPTNRYDRNAVKVMIDGQQVGHIPREIAALVAEPISSLKAQHGDVVALAEILGDGSGPGFGVVLYLKFQMLNVVIRSPEEDLDDALLLGANAPSSSASPFTERQARTVADAASELGVDEQVLDARRKTIEKAVEQWKSDLIDLSARNRLLYFRDLQTGSLSLDEAPREAMMNLVAGKKTALSKLVPKKLPKTSPVSKLTPFEDAVRRARSISRTARAYEEERGIRTLFLACGIATWKSDKASRPPAAPVLLVPIELKAKGASQKDFDLSPLGDLEVNPTLLHLLRVDYNLKLDEQELFAHADMDGAIDTPEELKVALDWLREKCTNLQGFEVLDRFVLGNFWYAKLPMVRDLENSVDTLSSHDVAAALAGHPEARESVIARRSSSVPPIGFVDRLEPSEEFNVLDSDSSQSLAIGRALAGEDLVLKGPPGTGKSQTIANLIAGAIGCGKKVLFVAEKRAAIDAVTKRLKSTGLEDLVLDLHSGAESRKWLAQQLSISLDAARHVGDANFGELHSRLSRVRDSLGAHAEALHQIHEPWRVSIFEAQIEVLERGRPTVSARLRGSDLEAVSRADLEQLVDRLRDLISLDGLSLGAKGSVWAESKISERSEVDAATQAIDQLLGTDFPELRRALPAACEATGIDQPRTLDELESTIQMWKSAEEVAEVLSPAIYEQDLPQMALMLGPLGKGGLSKLGASIFSSGFRAARSTAHESVVPGVEPDDSTLLSKIRVAESLEASWPATARGRHAPSFPNGLAALEACVGRLRIGVSTLAEFTNHDLLELPLDEGEKLVSQLGSEKSTLSTLPDIRSALEDLEAANLSVFLREVEDDQSFVHTAPDELRRVWWISVADELATTKTDPASMPAFRGERHEQYIQEFRDLENQHVAANSQRVRRAAATGAILAQDKYPKQAELVRGQANRKRGHLPVRELFTQAPDVVTALRPCWVMSPLMVSQLIPSDRAHFDLVIFDEASQVRPVDALSSMIRGRQLVVAGDERQLPPTTFFDSTSSTDTDTEEDEATEIGDYESVLDVLMNLFETEMLRWHYRSRDERLIGFSNSEIYGGSLTTFPGAVSGDVLTHVLVNDLPEEGERRVSPAAEVAEVVQLVLDHASNRPHESLGVIALGSAHSDAIEAGILEALAERSDLDPFFSDELEERFFVKNLERVQGDERDAIILAIGYGKNPDGSLPHRFGPLNNAGGERRLNVAVTRAKRRMTVVSSFEESDIDLNRSRSEGVRLLKSFLEYSSAGGFAGEATSDVSTSSLHQAIRETLVDSGHEVIVRPGTSVDCLDLAVVEPTTGVPAVAIDFDGLSYSERPSVRDRDRLRPEQLERLDWQYISAWSQDWYRDEAASAERLTDQVDEALAKAKRARETRHEVLSESDSSREAKDDIVPAREHFEARIRPPKPVFNTGGPSITDWSQADLVSLAAWIETDGLLRTSEELQADMMTELGISRRGRRVAEALETAVMRLRSSE